MTTTNIERKRALNLKAVKRYRAKNPLICAHRMRARRAAGKYVNTKYDPTAAKRHYEKFPERKAAMYAVRKAINKKELVREPCFICGAEAQAHHSSYDVAMWLVVTWLCPRCHGLAHREAFDLKARS